MKNTSSKKKVPSLKNSRPDSKADFCKKMVWYLEVNIECVAYNITYLTYNIEYSVYKNAY